MKLWNRNFTILVIGSFISALGSSAAGVAFGIMIFKETGSPLSLALFTIAHIIPRVVTSFLIGPFIDRNSRKKIIVTLDFTYTILFSIIAIILYQGFFNVAVFTAVGALFGVLDTIYQTAFMSMFPEVIPEGQHSKAYSISSLIWPVSAALMAPIAAFMITTFTFGTALLMAFNAITFFMTASMETTIKIEEKLNTSTVVKFQFTTDLKEGINYYKKEKGILGIGILFSAFAFVYAAHDLLRMPYFVNSERLGLEHFGIVLTLQHFSFLITASAVGRMIGGIIHYIFKYPVQKRFLIAVSVYFTVEILSATMLFLPYGFMIATSFIVGLLSVTSFNIRMSATQTYIPSTIRGRVNSTQSLLWNFGTILGCVLIGLIAEFSSFDYKYILLFVGLVTLSAIFMIPIRMKDEFKKIYNKDV